MPGTDDATFPVLSPDGTWVAFVSRGRLMKAGVRTRSDFNPHAAKPAADAKPAAEAKPGAAKDAPAAPAAAAPAPAPSAPTPADTGKVNSTHPARDGRGAGNLRDAIARQRAASERGRKNPAKSPAKSMRSSSKRGRR
jgi:hypothetical protein